MALTELDKSDKALKKALRYVSDYWLPMDRDLLDRIRQGIKSGFYDAERELLAQELQSDIGIFFGCIRELREILAERGAAWPSDPSLTEIVEDVDLDSMRLAIDNLMDSPTIHIMSESDDPQVNRLLEAVLSTSCAHTLAEGMGEEPGVASSVAALRQLGFALVAWNYPSVYQDSLSAMQAGSRESLEQLISKQLGFSPLLLGARLAQSWGLPVELVEASLVPSLPLYEEAHIVSSSHSTIAQICRISEALARAQFEDDYPTARTEWDLALREVERHLGTDGIEEIRGRCAALCRTVVMGSPDIFRPGLLLDEEVFSSMLQLDEHRNPYLQLCTDKVRFQLLELYALLKAKKPSDRALKFLMRKVIPTANFSGVCVFTVDPISCSLVPQLEVGSMGLRSTEPVSYLDDCQTDDPVPLAFLATDGCNPVMSEHNRVNLGCISSAFGRSQRLGVIYVEIPLGDMRLRNDQHMTHFRAVTHALVDCLGI